MFSMYSQGRAPAAPFPPDQQGRETVMQQWPSPNGHRLASEQIGKRLYCNVKHYFNKVNKFKN